MQEYITEQQDFFRLSFSKGRKHINSDYHHSDGRDFMKWMEPHYYLGKFPLEKRSDMHLELLQIEGINPSEVVIKIQRGGEKKQLPLYKYQTEMLFQNGIFFLDLKKKEDFQINLNEQYYSITILAKDYSSDWNVSFYGEFIPK